MDIHQSWIDRVTSKWWFYLVLLFLSFLPAYTTRPFDPRDTPFLIEEVLSSPLIYNIPAVFPFFKILPALLIWRMVIGGKNAARWFNGYAAFTIFLSAILQNSAQTEIYGFAVITGNLVVYSLLALIWTWEALVQRGQYQLAGRPAWRYWVVPLAFLAFWMPASLQDGTPVPDFFLLGLVANEAGLTFCMMLPVYLAVLTLSFPTVNLVLLRVSGWVGFITALFNVFVLFTNPGYGWWMGALHIPLLSLSIFALVLGFLPRFALQHK